MYEFREIDFEQMGETQVETIEPSHGQPAIYEDMLAYVKSVVDFNAASLLLLTKKKKLQIVAKYGEGCNFIDSMRFKMGNGLSAWLAQRKRTICLSDIHRGARHGHNPIRSFVAVPILFQENVIGILNLAHILPNAFGPEEVETIEQLLASLASKINGMLSIES